MLRHVPWHVPRRDALVAAALGALVALSALAYFFASDQKPALLVLLAVEIAAGREAGIPAGLSAGLDWRQAAIATSFIELTSLFLLFPLLVALAAGLHRVAWLERHLQRAQDYARRNPDVDVLALGALTFMPFLPVGALTSVLIGELLRLPSRYLLPVLAAALVCANVLTAYATARLLSFFPDPRLVAGGMAGLLLVGAGVAWLLHRRGAPARGPARP
ncbi:MAG TPA: hypothetical protein VM582_00800 [Candidatus Thermoplasmatota archaeon]|nr:hypothetical protein [Candidatus Thermoplasmatota archaeon]